MRSARVKTAHGPPEHPPVVLPAGERMAFERRETEWEGWLWCQREDGSVAWVPEPWVRVEGDHCVMERDYDSFELTAEPGEDLVVEETVSGWAWTRRPNGERGWIPIENLT